ncbi:MAG: M36 family metallopeptidase, partial [Xanthomonadales bacterium]|nr:M36 family metallopeptidase [Xanthomonadales bacterium]
EFAGDALSQDRIPVAAQYYYDVSQRHSAPVLAWEAVIRPHHSSDWWQCWIDAETGALLNQVNWTQEASYHVYPEPLESPLDGNTQLIDDAADTLASPFGWHDTDGNPGAEFTDTRGNNVMAQEDTDDSNDGGRRPDGGVDLIFDFPLDLSAQDPTQYENFAITNLFYWNNYIHDVLYHVGFDEASGNFQENNYGNGGVGGDAVRADTHDGSGLNNANFSSPPDGTPGRMQMFIFTPPAVVEVTAPANIAGNYRAVPANFGPDITQAGFQGTLALVDDGSAMPTEACDPLVGFPAGRVAVIDRTDFRCEFSEQALNAQSAGASGVIVINNRPGNRAFSMDPGSVGDQITIPSAMIGNDDGLTIRAEINQGVDINLRLDTHTTIRRDSDIDNGVIAHEYGHGLSIRLTGGASTSSCLFFSQQAGEGWSDFLALALTAEPNDTAETPRGIGRYLRYRDNDPLGGFRAAPYSRDLNINSFTYGDIADAGRSGSPLTIPHGVGTVWATALWDMYWNLVDRYGFEADLINGNGGNKLALQLVVDGLKMQPCLPSFLDARDAILLADEVNNGGANQCEIWQAFARRGMGISADDGGGVGTLAVTEAFDQPSACSGLIYQDGFEG